MKFVNWLRSKLAINVLGGFFVLFLVFAYFIAGIGYRQFMNIIVEEYVDGAFRTANQVRAKVEVDSIEEYNTGGKWIDKLILDYELETLCANMQNSTIFIMIVDPANYYDIRFVSVTASDGYTLEDLPKGFIRNLFTKDYQEMIEILMTGKQDEAGYIRLSDRDEIPNYTVMESITNDADEVIAIVGVQDEIKNYSYWRSQYFDRVVYTGVIFVFVILFLYGVYLNRRMVRPIQVITAEADSFSRTSNIPQIRLKDQVKNKDEIGTLAVAIDRMEDETETFIRNLLVATEEKERVSSELRIAREIQYAVLPSEYPDDTRFDLYAEMNPALEVGGDLYDFFLVDNNHIALAIADVSGKGMPAALYMMIVKMLLDDNTMREENPARVLEYVNHQLCKNDKMEMFVTIWLGIMDVTTGKVVASNAGHEYPIIARKDGKFEIYKDKHGLVAGGMDNMRYQNYEFVLEPEDVLLVYTDGLPEATNSDNQLFGLERTLDTLNSISERDPQTVVTSAKAAADEFVGAAAQFDDMTMLCVRYLGNSSGNTITISAETENLEELMEFTDRILDETDCSMKDRMQVELAVEEVFTNICSYAYKDSGPAIIRAETDETGVTFIFEDKGVQYDPLARQDPDITLSAEDRDIGGLGIYLVKKTMDDASYRYENGRNILTFRKNLKGGRK